MPELDSVANIIRFLFPDKPFANAGRLLGVSPHTVEAWLSGYKRIPEDKSEALASYFSRLAAIAGNTLAENAKYLREEKRIRALTVKPGNPNLNPDRRPQPVRL